MIDADRSEDFASDCDAGTPSHGTVDDYCEYIADMLLEMQLMASKSGREGLAEILGVAYEKAREKAHSK